MPTSTQGGPTRCGRRGVGKGLALVVAMASQRTPGMTVDCNVGEELLLIKWARNRQSVSTGCDATPGLIGALRGCVSSDVGSGTVRGAAPDSSLAQHSSENPAW